MKKYLCSSDNGKTKEIYALNPLIAIDRYYLSYPKATNVYAIDLEENKKYYDSF